MWIRSSEFFVCLLVVVCWFFLVWSLFACFVLVRGWSLSWPFLSTPSFHSVSLAKHLQSISLFFSRSHSSDRGIAPQRHYTSKTKTVLFQKLHRHGSDKRCFQDQFAFVIGQPRGNQVPKCNPTVSKCPISQMHLHSHACLVLGWFFVALSVLLGPVRCFLVQLLSSNCLATLC